MLGTYYVSGTLPRVFQSIASTIDEESMLPSQPTGPRCPDYATPKVQWKILCSTRKKKWSAFETLEHKIRESMKLLV